MVRKGNETFLTRAGNFRVTPSGELVTRQGYNVVLSDGKSPITVNPSSGPWRITAEAAVVQADSSQNLAIAKPVSLGDLVKTGENLFRSLAEPQALPPAGRTVDSGFIEGSGVEPTKENDRP